MFTPSPQFHTFYCIPWYVNTVTKHGRILFGGAIYLPLNLTIYFGSWSERREREEGRRVAGIGNLLSVYKYEGEG